MPVFSVALSLILLLLPFFVPSLFFLEFVGFVPLFFINRNFGAQVLIGAVFGFLYQIILVSFLYEPIHVHAGISSVYAIALIGILAFYLAAWWVIFFISIKLFHNKIYIVPIIGVVLEAARDHIFTGVPLFDLYLTQFQDKFLLGYAHFSSYLITFLLLLINVFIYIAIAKKKPAFAMPVIAILLIGYFLPANHLKISPIKILVISEDIAQDKRWDPDLYYTIINRYIKQTKILVKRFHPNLVVWPEAAVPIVWNEYQEDNDLLTNLEDDIKIPLLTGLLSFSSYGYTNSAFLFKGTDIYRYDKIHLVPFGEYLPIKSIFDKIVDLTQNGEDLKSGNKITVFNVGGTKIAAPICYETMFPFLIKRFKQAGATIAVNITNDGWFSHTFAPKFFTRLLRFRAVENSIYFLRASNDGPTRLFDPNGTIVKPKISGTHYFIFDL